MPRSIPSTLARWAVGPAFLALATKTPAFGQCEQDPFNWVATGGLLTDPANWAQGVVPGPGSTIIFESITPVFTELELESLLVERLILRGGLVELAISPDVSLTADGTEFACPALIVGGPTPARLSLGGLVSRTMDGLVVHSAIVGSADGRGRIDSLFSSPNFTPSVRVETDLVVGGESEGELDRLGIFGAGRLIVGRNAPGRVTLTDELRVGGLAIIGDDALGEMENSNLWADELVVGARSGGLGDVAFSFGSLTISGDAEVGARGFGLLRFRSESTGTIGGDLRLGVFAIGEQPGWFDRGDGLVIVEGESLLDVGGNLALGVLGHAELEVVSPARVRIGGAITTGPGGSFSGPTDRRVTIRLDTPLDDTPIISAEGPITMPELEVRFASGFVPAAGDAWPLIESGVSLTMANDEPPAFPLLPSGLAWSVFDDGRQLTATVITAGSAADIDGNGAVDFSDLLAVLQGYGPCPTGEPCPSDVDGNQQTDFADLVFILAQWG